MAAIESPTNCYTITSIATIFTIIATRGYMGGCQNYNPFLGTLNIRCRFMIGNQKRDHNFDNHPYRGCVGAQA